MTWRDNYRTASFRGVNFHVESADSSHGRRQAVHEHAQRDVPYTEDLGRKAREFSVSGYLIGADYHLQRDALVAACEVAGPGQLVHPYRGELSVVCRGLTVSESSQDGGMCRVSLTFLEAGQASFPRAVTDNVNAISSAAEALKDAAKLSFLKEFLTTGFPAQVMQAAQAGLAEVADFIADPGFNFSAEIAAASELYYEARNMAADAFDLVQAPFKMADRMLGTVGLIRGGFGFSSFGVLRSMFSLFGGSESGGSSGGGGGGSSGSTTPSRRQIIANRNATNDFTRHLAIAEASKEAIVRLATFTPATAQQPGASESVFGAYPSVQDVIIVRDQLTDAIDLELESERTSDEVFVALSALRTEIVRGIPQPGQRLPQVVDYVPAATLPALVVAYNLYGDASRADEIAARNKPTHPGFLTGGKAIEVLADG